MLPHGYTELVVERLRQKDTALRDFLDLFHHRIISLFYQAWEKYRFMIAYERGERDRFSHHLLDLVGLGTPGLQDRQDIADDSLIYYSGLLSLNTRSAAALEQILTDYFEVPVEVEQFVGAWYPLDAENQCHIGDETECERPVGFGRGGGRRDLGSAVQSPHPSGPAGISAVPGFSAGGERVARVARPGPALHPRRV